MIYRSLLHSQEKKESASQPGGTAQDTEEVCKLNNIVLLEKHCGFIFLALGRKTFCLKRASNYQFL